MKLKNVTFMAWSLGLAVYVTCASPSQSVGEPRQLSKAPVKGPLPKAKAADSKSQLFRDLFAGYRRNNQGFELDILRTSVNTLLQKERKVTGKLEFFRGKLRLEIAEPDKSLVVNDGRYLWIVQDDGMGQVVVNRVKTKTLSRAQALWSILFDREAFEKLLREKSQLETGDAYEFTFVPRKKNSNEVLEVKIAFSKTSKDLLRLSYQDDRENSVLYEVKRTNFVEAKSVDLDRFKLTPPQGATVIDL